MRVKTTVTQNKITDTLFEFHNDVNKIVSAAALAIVTGEPALDELNHAKVLLEAAIVNRFTAARLLILRNKY